MTEPIRFIFEVPSTRRSAIGRLAERWCSDIYELVKNIGKWGLFFLWGISAEIIVISFLTHSPSIASYASLILIPAGFFLVSYLVGKFKPRRVILYLRRFHSTEAWNRVNEIWMDSNFAQFKVISLYDKSGETNPTNPLDFIAYPLTIMSLFIIMILAIQLDKWFPFISWLNFSSWDNGYQNIAFLLLLSFAAVPVQTGIRNIQKNRKGLIIQNEESLQEITARIERFRARAEKFLQYRVMKINPEDNMWQATIIRASEMCDAILIDASELSANVVWELETLIPKYGRKIVIFADERAARQLVDLSYGLDETGEKCRLALSGREMVILSSENRKSQFLRTLAALLNTASNPLPRD